MFETKPAAAIVVPRGLKNESCHEWILGGIMPSHFRFRSMAEFIEPPPTWTAFLLGIISEGVNRAISTMQIQKYFLFQRIMINNFRYNIVIQHTFLKYILPNTRLIWKDCTFVEESCQMY